MEALEANKQLTDRVFHDLNTDPWLGFPANSFDAVRAHNRLAYPLPHTHMHTYLCYRPVVHSFMRLVFACPKRSIIAVIFRSMTTL